MKSLKLFLAGAIAMAGIVSISSCKGDERIAATDVELNETKLSLKVGETFKLIAFVLPSNATNQSVKWESDDEEVATVKGGTVTAVAEGPAVITATAADGSGEEARCNVTVVGDTPTPAKSITVGEQEGKMVAGQSGTVTYAITTTGIAANHYMFSVSNLPQGVNNFDELDIDDNGGSTITLTGNGTQTAGTYDNLTLRIEGTTSAPFTLTVEEQSEAIPVVTITNHSSNNLGGGSGWVLMQANITSDGGTPIVERGMKALEVYADQSFTRTFKDSGTGTGTFSINTEYGLQGNKLSIRAYAINEAGYTGYSEWVTIYEE